MIAIPSLLFIQHIRNLEFEPREQFVGTLTTDQDPVIVYLPADVSVREVLVARGQTVTAGDTVAIFDIGAIEAARLRAENETAALILERRCLLDQQLFDDLDNLVLNIADLADQDLAVALEMCRSYMLGIKETHGAADLDQSDIVERQTALLEHQRTLLAQISNTQDGVGSEQVLFAALRVELQLLETQRQEIEVDLGQKSRVRAAKRDRLNRLRELSELISKNDLLLERLNAALAQPRVISPVSGRLQRVRAIQRGTVLPESVELLQITPADHTDYVVQFPVPLDALSTLSIGDQVEIRPLGISLNSMLELYGEISEFDNALAAELEQRVIVKVTLSQESGDTLRAPNVRLALHGTRTASIISVRRTNLAMVSVIRDIIGEQCTYIAKNCTDYLAFSNLEDTRL